MLTLTIIIGVIKIENTIISSTFLKYIAAFFAIIQLSFVAAPTAVSAAEATYEPTEAEIEEVADLIQFMYEEAATTDLEGNIISLDFDVLKSSFGNSEELEEIEAITLEAQSVVVQPGEFTTSQTFTQCMSTAFRDQFGVTVSTSVFAAVGAYLRAGSWKAAAKAIIAVMGAKPALAVVAGWLAWNTGVCL